MKYFIYFLSVVMLSYGLVIQINPSIFNINNTPSTIGGLLVILSMLVLYCTTTIEHTDKIEKLEMQITRLKNEIELINGKIKK